MKPEKTFIFRLPDNSDNTASTAGQTNLVCERAGISRSTFYRYYADIYDWRKQIEKECLDLLKENMLNASDIQCRWARHYGACGTMGVIQCWIGDGLLQPPEEVADCIVYILTKTME